MKKRFIYFCAVLIPLIIYIVIKVGYPYSKAFSVNTGNLINLNNSCIAHFIDVGQGDCILIQVGKKNILIDCGPNSSEKEVKDYLKKLGIREINYLIATHPHEDHIGGIDEILKNFTVDSIYAPKIINTNEDFINLITELSKQNKRINVAEKGLVIKLDDKGVLYFFSPESKHYENLNNYSAVIKLQYGNTSFLFTGDSENLIENKLIFENTDLTSDVLKVGHHGSKTSTSKEFLNKVKPKYAIISCGMGNDYGHPDKQVVSLLKGMGTNIYRTDIDGNIIVISDGKNITVTKKDK